MNPQTPPHRPGFARVEILGTQIYSTAFDDIYYSRDDGIAESRYVFLQSNGLPEHWQGKARYCIAETGFGSGLNFLLTLQAWKNDPKRCERLDYFAIEGFPLQASQLRKLYQDQPEIEPLAKPLIQQYPPVSHGLHSLSFEYSRVQLHLIFSEASLALATMKFRADSWFLDGFAPAKNPGMWQPDVLSQLAQHARPGSRIATFTAAGEVRRNLISAGFDIRKRKGFGRKREMLCGTFSEKQPGNAHKTAPWFNICPVDSQPQTAAVIGAGIAGAQIARHLAERGIKVQVLESAPQIATGASGNLAGVLAPKLSACPGDEEDFSLVAFLYQLRQINTLRQQGHDIEFAQQGLLQITRRSAAKHRLDCLSLREDLGEQIFQLISEQNLSACPDLLSCPDSYLIPLAGSLAPDSLCRALLSHPNITLRCNQAVRGISPLSPQPGVHLQDQETQHFDAVVLANGYQAGEFSDALDITPVRGQSSSAELKGDRLQHAIAHGGYVVTQPNNPGHIIFGASHERNDCSMDLRTSETLDSLKTLRQHCPDLGGNLKNIQASHAGIRATTTDRWPLTGPLPDKQFYRREYADLHLGKLHHPYPDAAYHPGIYVLSGLGSRGLCTAGYCANLLAHMICGTAPPASQHVLHALHPGRFLIRQSRKQG